MKTILSEIWINSSNPEYSKLYSRIRKTWTIEKKPIVFSNLSQEEKRIYYRDKMRKHRENKRILKLKELRWQ